MNFWRFDFFFLLVVFAGDLGRMNWIDHVQISLLFFPFFFECCDAIRIDLTTGLLGGGRLEVVLDFLRIMSFSALHVRRIPMGTMIPLGGV